MNRRVFVLFLTLFCSLTQPLRPQDTANVAPPPAASPKPPKPQFFAGTVVEADADHIKVSRNLLGRPAETHVFVLDGKTKAPKGGIKPNSRVTIRYQHLPDHDLALEIQVRNQSHTSKSS